MTEQRDLRYLELKERHARELAVETGDVSVRLIHLKSADAYAARIAALLLRNPLRSLAV